jgi:hypothetical protein
MKKIDIKQSNAQVTVLQILRISHAEKELSWIGVSRNLLI